MILLRTAQRRGFIDYTVERGKETLWHRRVHRGEDHDHRPGGYAFSDARRAQRALGRTYALEHGESLEDVIEEAAPRSRWQRFLNSMWRIQR